MLGFNTLSSSPLSAFASAGFFIPAGLEATLILDEEGVFAGSIEGVTGVEATTFIGDVTTLAYAVGAPTGVVATLQVGEGIVTAGAEAAPTGQQMTTALGDELAFTVTTYRSPSFTLTASIEGVIIWVDVDDSQTPNYRPVIG